MRAIHIAKVTLIGCAMWSAQAAGASATESGERPSRAAIRALLEKEAARLDLPADIAEAVVKVESSFDPSTVGLVGEIGLMQVRPQTAAMLGFRGTPDDLAKPEINIHYGVTYLAKAWRLADGDLCRALMKYRAGHGEEVMSPLSVTYCNRARNHLASLNSSYAIEGVRGEIAPLPKAPASAASAKPATVASVAASPSGPPQRVYAKFRQGTPAASKAYWAAHEARIRTIKARLASKWRQVASR